MRVNVRHRLTGAAFLPASAAIAVAGAAWACTAGITLDHNAGPPGSSVTVSGVAFSSGGPITVRWDDPGNTVLARTDGAQADFVVTITIPQSSAPTAVTHDIVASQGNVTKSAPFEVTPRPPPAPQPPPGQAPQSGARPAMPGLFATVVPPAALGFVPNLVAPNARPGFVTQVRAPAPGITTRVSEAPAQAEPPASAQPSPAAPTPVLRSLITGRAAPVRASGGMAAAVFATSAILLLGGVVITARWRRRRPAPPHA